MTHVSRHPSARRLAIPSSGRFTMISMPQRLDLMWMRGCCSRRTHPRNIRRGSVITGPQEVRTEKPQRLRSPRGVRTVLAQKNLRIGIHFRSGGAPRLQKPIVVAVGLKFAGASRKHPCPVIGGDSIRTSPHCQRNYRHSGNRAQSCKVILYIMLQILIRSDPQVMPHQKHTLGSHDFIGFSSVCVIILNPAARSGCTT